MAGIRENLDVNFQLAMDDPEKLVKSHPSEAKLFGDEKLIYNYRNPASSDMVRDLGEKLRLLWLEIAEATGSDRMTPPNFQNSVAQARTHGGDFKVTAHSMHDFAKFGPQQGMSEYLGVFTTELVGGENLTVLGDDANGLPIVSLERSGQEVIAAPVPSHDLTFTYDVGDRIGFRSGSIPASDRDIEAAIMLLEVASPRHNSGLYPVQRAA